MHKKKVLVVGGGIAGMVVARVALRGHTVKLAEKGIELSDADVVVIATGSRPIALDFGTSLNVLYVAEVLDDKSKAGENIVMYTKTQKWKR